MLISCDTPPPLSGQWSMASIRSPFYLPRVCCHTYERVRSYKTFKTLKCYLSLHYILANESELVLSYKKCEQVQPNSPEFAYDAGSVTSCVNTYLPAYEGER